MNGKRRDQGTPDQQVRQPPPETDKALSMSRPVEQGIEKALGEVLPPDEASKATQQVMRVIAHEVSMHHGPIPDPETFKAYNGVLPGAADRILTMAEREQAHRVEWEMTAIRAEARNSTLGLVFGIMALLLLVAGAIGALSLGSPIVSGVFVGTTALGLIPAFIRGRGLFNWFSGSDNEAPPREGPPPKKK